MSLKALLESLDGLPEAVSTEYTKVKVDGKDMFQLDVAATGNLSLGDHGKLQRALQEERKTRDELKKNLDAFKDEDGNLIVAADAHTAIKELEELGDEATVDAKVKAGLQAKEKQLQDKYTAQERQLLEKHQEELGKLNTNLTATTAQLQVALIDQEATLAITEAEGSPELLLPIIRGNSRMVRSEDGKHQVEVIGTDGNARLSQKPGTGTELMTIGEYVSLLKEDDKFGRAFESSGASGSGANNQDSHKSTTSGKPFHISAADAKVHAKYTVAKEAADKAGQALIIQ